jgi:glucose/arabinose dehydrogenase
LTRALGVVAAALVAVSCASAAGERSQLRLRTFISGLDSPLYATIAPGEPNNLYVVEQPGRILVATNGKLRKKPFLDIREIVRSGGEQGLLSVAFHPKYEKNHRFYVDYTDAIGDTRVAEYRSNGRTAAARVRQLLYVKQPYPNHNGGQLQFGPDGLLYVGMGDGGSAGDPQNHAQDLSSRLGKLLTIDVDSKRPVVDVAGFGLRNLWRFSFDSAGNLYIGDVGQDSWEEVDYTPRKSPGIENYGWNVYEGKHTFEAKEPNSAGHLVSPVTEYSHDLGCSITGGYVWKGRYYYGDFCTGRVWSLKIAGVKATGVRSEAIRVPSLASWAVDGHGSLLAVSLSGKIYRVS